MTRDARIGWYACLPGKARIRAGRRAILARISVDLLELGVTGCEAAQRLAQMLEERAAMSANADEIDARQRAASQCRDTTSIAVGKRDKQ